MATQAKRLKAVIFDIKCNIAGVAENYSGETMNLYAIEGLLSITSGNPSCTFIPVGDDRYISIKTIESICIKKVLEE